MLVTDLRHVEHQAAMTPALKKAFDFLKQPGLSGMSDGKAEIDGQRVYAIVQRYETEASRTPRFERHASYIDVQFIVSGEEIIGWSPAERMAETGAYNAEKDICFGTAPAGTWTPVRLQAGQLAILYPEDGHAPRLAVRAPSPVMKIVIKVAV